MHSPSVQFPVGAVLRPATHGDEDLLTDLVQDAPAYMAQFFHEDGTIDAGRYIDETNIFFLEVRDETVGYGTIIPRRENTCEIEYVIRSTRRGEGLGHTLVRQLVAHARLHYHVIMASATDDNVAAQRVLATAGFREADVKRNDPIRQGKPPNTRYYDFWLRIF